ncbi:RTC4-like domain containing protein [Ceratobasidium theobromae]|uniref:Restriction of telomere capping protein 4 n=1 Tax=Ceratobasidium theobromae TaxID=1582974 RepID=A0A5N5QGE2_9AGAM|nr:RTC4-like domain containing protein [Ceratobasidium theobromae]
MEKRRQLATLGNALQPLGNNKDRKATRSSGLGEDLGSTTFKSTRVLRRPLLTANPKAVKVKENPKGKARAASPTSSEETGVLDESADPIDFISQQPQKVLATKSNLGAQPPPFAKSRLSKLPIQPEPTSTASAFASSKPGSTRTAVAKSRRIVESDSDSTSSNRVTRSKLTSKDSPPQPTSHLPTSRENGPILRQKAARVAQPPPFAKLPRAQNPTRETEKPIPPVKKLTPPWKRDMDSTKGKVKRNSSEEVVEVGIMDASPGPGSEISSINSDMLKGIRIPRKNGKNPPVIVLEPTKEASVEPKKKPQLFPMAAYAKEAAAKQEANASQSPRKRFKPDEVERLIKRAEEDELMGIDDETMPHLDPKDLCPFCDEPLPENPSPDLLQLLADLRETAAPEPRLRNPLGLTAPLATFINLCHMHRAESTHVEQGRRNHWPSVIDWGSVRERLRSPRVIKGLQNIISDPNISEFFVTLYNTIKRDGVLKVASIRGQLDTFESSYPGYYGEQGLLVFFDILNELFPNLTSEECKPLTTRQFFMSVLVPEAAALLIEEDMDCTHEEALVTLRESRQYGLAMFPDRGGFFGSGIDDHMDEAGAKQLEWRKDMIRSSHSGELHKAQSPPFKAKMINFRNMEIDPDVLVVD